MSFKHYLIYRQVYLLKVLIRHLVAQTKADKPRLLSDDQLGDTIFMLLEGAVSTGTIIKDAEPIRAAKKIAEKLIQ